MEDFKGSQIKEIKKDEKGLQVTFQKTTKIHPNALRVRYRILTETKRKIEEEMQNIEEIAKQTNIGLE